MPEVEDLQRRYFLAERRWPEIAGRRDADQQDAASRDDDRRTATAPTLLLVPVGSCEQHGPHLPMGTDTLIATALALSACPSLEGDWRPLVAPSIAIGASGEHAGFAGTLSLGVEATTANLIELVRSADWAARIVFVNGHGGNAAALRGAVERSHRDGRVWVSAWSPRSDVIASLIPGESGPDESSPAQSGPGDQPMRVEHAGWIETSVMLHLYPNLVDLDAATAGPTAVDPEVLVASGVAAVSANGVLGDPTGANASSGRAMVDAWLDDLCAHIAAGGLTASST